METESKLRLADVFVLISDPRQVGKVEHDLVERLVVAVNAVLAIPSPRLICGRTKNWTGCAVSFLRNFVCQG